MYLPWFVYLYKFTSIIKVRVKEPDGDYDSDGIYLQKHHETMGARH
jgi:hypothetical protein